MHLLFLPCLLFFFFNDTATTEIYTLSLHDALPICQLRGRRGHADLVRLEWRARARAGRVVRPARERDPDRRARRHRSEEHTSELQSRRDLVCRLLLEKKKKKNHEQIESR